MALTLHRLGRCCLAALLGLLTAAALAQGTVQAVPALSGHVVDSTATLTAAQQQALESKLMAFEQSAGTQLVVLIIASTAPEDIASYANRVGNAWKIGRKEVGDGLLLVVAKNDRKLRIEVAKALEGAVPDLAAKQVIDQAITPRFKQGDFAGGLDAGVERLMQLVRHEDLPTPTNQPAHGTASGVEKALAGIFGFTGVALTLALGISGFFGALLFSTTGALAAVVTWFYTESYLATLLMGIFGYAYGIYVLLKWAGKGSTAVSGGAARTTTTTDNSGSWWSSSGSSDSSSFSSGGGGDFGGGGASGDW